MYIAKSQSTMSGGVDSADCYFVTLIQSPVPIIIVPTQKQRIPISQVQSLVRHLLQK